MALYTVTNGTSILAQDIDQCVNNINGNALQWTAIAGSDSVLTNQSVQKTWTFPGAYSSRPAISGSCTTTATEPNVKFSVVSFATSGSNYTGVTVKFGNLDGSTQTLSNYSIIAAGTLA